MKKQLLAFFCIIIAFSSAYSQKSFWTKISEEKTITASKIDRASLPLKYQLFSLQVDDFKAALLNAPNDLSGQTSSVIIPFPNAEGVLMNYRVYNSPVMEEGLAKKFPDIQTFLAKGIDDPTAVMRFSITQFGIHTMTLSGKTGTAFIDTYTTDQKNYIVYKKSDLTRVKSFECGFDEVNNEPFKMSNENLLRTSDGNFRIYRLAMACTGEYAQFHGGTVAAAQAAIVVTVNRVNTLYERDFSARLSLVANNNLLIYTNGATDPYTNNSGGAMLGENQTNVTNVIGSANYDIGHVVSTNGGGVAGLGVVCNTSQKARGVTGTTSPIGDPFDIDYVAHEVGHQFGCNHTFNNSCGGNRNNSTAVEPGSGSTIMAYAGICSPNVQGNSNDHFSFISIAEATSRTFLGTSCASISVNNNAAPIVNAGLDYTIPRGTAFILKGSATDANNDALTYCWEQTNTEISTQAPLSTSTTGPNFRSNSPTSFSDRYMPRIQDVINNNLTPMWEVVPNVARTMNFALTVRDNRSPNGGQTGRDDMIVTTAAVGPFLVNSPNTAVSWVVGTNQNVTWDIAGTTANGINATFVDVFLSTDGGFTYPILLASKVPNDGSETITVPNNPGTQNRIMVRGYKHIFYDISNANFTITAAPSTFSVAFSGIEETQNKSSCQGTNVSFDINYASLGGFSGTTTFSAVGNPAGSVINFSPSSIAANGIVTMTISNTNSSPIGFFNIIVTASSGGVTKNVSFYLNLSSSSFAAMSLTSPVNNATNQSTNLVLNWAVNANANSYDVQVATDNAFSNIISSGTVTNTSYTLNGLLISTDYFWRVLPKNTDCSGVYSAISKFTTGQTLCRSISSTNVPIAISSSGTPTISSTLNVPFGGTISDVNITMNVSHSWINDLTATLRSPSGAVVQLFSRPCTNASILNINATFDDSGVAVVCGTNPGISGTVLPTQTLSGFNGSNPSGTWTLTIADAFDQDGGALNSWSIDVCALQTLATDDFEFQDFALFPNPNKGSFTVKFLSDTSNNIAINVHDISGRQVYNNTFSNTGTFNQNINLDKVQSGVYLVSITDGSKKTVKRIIVE